MSPDEKAIELYNKFRNENPVLSANVRAKKQALISIDEILSFVPYQDYNKNTLCPYDGAELSVDYWEEVKKEIHKL